MLEEFQEEGTEPMGKGQSCSWEITADFPQGLRSPGILPELGAEIFGMAPVEVQKDWECREGPGAGDEGQTPISDIQNQIAAVSYQQLFTANYPQITSEHKSGRYQDNFLFIKGKKSWNCSPSVSPVPHQRSCPGDPPDSPAKKSVTAISNKVISW